MKILKITLPNGFQMLKPGFTLNFLTKTRVDKNGINEDLLELEKDLYLPKETAFIGKNSSGKSTVLRLILIVLNFLRFGRVHSIFLETNIFKLDVVYYNEGNIYNYKGSFKKTLGSNEYASIVDEELGVTTLKAHYNKDLSNASYSLVKTFTPNIGLDTSFISKYNDLEKEFTTSINNLEIFNDAFESLLSFIPEDIMNNIIHLFDDSVEYIRLPKKEDNTYLFNNTFIFKRVNKDPILLEGAALKNLLSDGTIRGIKLYAPCVLAFRLGGTILIDEIEKNFNKNLIFNLIDMFNDEEINVGGATLIYTTHYSEILDNSSRCDNINVLHREKDLIDIKNMSLDYNLRTELKKSDQFDQNAFDNLINYDSLMTLKRSLRK